MGHTSSSHQFAIMSLEAGQTNYHEVCTIYLSHSAMSSNDCGKGSGSAVEMAGSQKELAIVVCCCLYQRQFTQILGPR